MDSKAISLRELMTDARQRLAGEYGEREAAAMVDEMMFRIKGWDRTQTIIRGDDDVSEFLKSRVEETTARLLDGEPIQYIFGKARFYGMDFEVTPATLIPRPETAQLVDMIIDRYGDRRDLRVLDLGTGSGCIAIALARNLPFPEEVTAVDISGEAITVAKHNAEELKAKVNFVNADMLSDGFAGRLTGKYDIIVSNPPYIADHEATGMGSNVLDHEPHNALFVPDSDPLLFYRHIATLASEKLNDAGMLFFEINPLFVRELVEMLHSKGFNDVEVVKDMQKADRFIIAKR